MNDNQTKIIKLYSFVGSLESFAVLGYLLSLPTDPKNSFILGFSLNRWIIFLGVFVIAILFLYNSFGVKKDRGKISIQNILARSNLNYIEYSWWGSLIVSIVLFITQIYFSNPNPNITDQLIGRLMPILLLAGLISFQTLLLLSYIFKSRSAFNWEHSLIHLLGLPRKNKKIFSLYSPITKFARERLKLNSFRMAFIFVFILAVFMHTISALSAPLNSEPDSVAYFQAAIQLVDDFKLDDPNTYRGYGISFFSLPIFWIFKEHSTWAIKTMFHLWGVGSVMLTFLIAWEISKKELFTFATGIFVLILSDLTYYGNQLLSEAPAAFFVTLFAYLMIKYFQDKRIKWIYFSGITATTATFIRPEYVLLVVVFTLFIGGEYVRKNTEILRGKIKRHFGFIRHFVISLVISLIPLLLWSYHNFKYNGFFGLTDYTYAVIYEGTIHSTYRVNQVPKLLNPNSSAVQKIYSAINNVFPELVSQLGIEEDYPRTGKNFNVDSVALSLNGYSYEEIKELSYQAVFDTVSNQPKEFVELIFLKLFHGLRPIPYTVQEIDQPMVPELQQFFTDNISPGQNLKKVQDFQMKIYKFRISLLTPTYYWRLFSFFSLFYYILHRERFGTLGLLAAVAFLTSIFPLILGVMVTRYTIPGAMLMYTIGLYTVWKLGKYLHNR